MKFTEKRGAKALIGVIAASALVVGALSGCAQNASEEATEDQAEVITVAAVPTPHAEVLNDVVKPILADQGYDLVVQEFTDYVLPNTATEEGEVDANYFQHVPYLDSFNADRGTHLVAVTAVHFEPFGLYSEKISDINEVSDGATVAIPNDVTNEARALLLLEAVGLIDLDDNAGITATPNDIISNPKNLQFEELEAAIVPTVLQDVELAAINGNYAIAAGLSSSDALAIEATDSLAAQTYANVLVVKEGNENTPAIQALAAALNSDAVRDYLNENYGGAVLAVF